MKARKTKEKQKEKQSQTPKTDTTGKKTNETHNIKKPNEMQTLLQFQ